MVKQEKLVFIGDIHGKFNNLEGILQNLKERDIKGQIRHIFLLGDIGIGFPYHFFPEVIEPSNKVKFIRGNHDNPIVCAKHKNYLGDYGYLEDLKLFYISGAYSIDKQLRTEGIDWWGTEELNWEDSNNLIRLYEEVKPEIVISHDCPFKVLKHMYSNNLFHSHTASLLDSLLEIYEPKHWFFAHHHKSKQFKEGKTSFRCLNELELIKIPFKQNIKNS